STERTLVQVAGPALLRRALQALRRAGDGFRLLRPRGADPSPPRAEGLFAPRRAPARARRRACPEGDGLLAAPRLDMAWASARGGAQARPARRVAPKAGPRGRTAPYLRRQARRTEPSRGHAADAGQAPE